ncbi:hypothetical protein GOE20_03175 [Sinorhizobium medicae]|nr:hypothetical protein [Sinorhizobium medicae]
MKRALILLYLFASPAFANDRNAFEFSAFPAGKTYVGPTRKPDFKARDKEFSSFRTRILEGMKDGPRFAGEYSVIQFGCGTGCSGVVVANNRTGQLYSFPRGGEFNQALTLDFNIDSKLMVARWYTDSFWETCVIESFLMDDGKWIAKDALASKGDGTCSGDVSEGVAKARGY